MRTHIVAYGENAFISYETLVLRVLISKISFLFYDSNLQQSKCVLIHICKILLVKVHKLWSFDNTTTSVYAYIVYAQRELVGICYCINGRTKLSVAELTK